MRTLLCCLSVLYASAALDDDFLLKPSQGNHALEMSLEPSPDWIGTSAKMSLLGLGD